MFFSIITINRNNAKGLEDTIQSVLSQDRNLYEFIIIDGASSDNSLEVIKKYESQIHYYISEPDTGIYNAMNKGIDKAKGEYAIFMNSGDSFSYPTALNDISKNNLNADFLFSGWTRIKNGKKLASYLPKEKITLYTLFYHSTCVCHQATFIKVSVLKELQGYEEKLKVSADICFVMKALVVDYKTFQILPYYITNLDVTGISGNLKGMTILNEEKPAYFKKLCPYVYDDYIKMHKILRFSPTNIFRFIKWKLWKDKCR